MGARHAIGSLLLSGSALIITQSPSEAEGLVRFLDEQRQRVLAIPLIGLTGVNEPLRGARIEASGERAQLSASLTLRLADALLDLVL